MSESLSIACPALLAVNRVPAPGAEFNIRSIPTMVIIRHRDEIARHSDAVGAADIVRCHF